MEVFGLATSVVQLISFTIGSASQLQKAVWGLRTSYSVDAQLIAGMQSVELDLRQINEALDLGDIDDGTKRMISVLIYDYREKLEALNAVLRTLPTQSRSIEFLHTSQIKKATSELRRTIEDISGFAKFSEQLQLQRVEGRSALHAWLSAPDPTLNYRNALKRRQPDTGEWFLGSDRYLKWRDGKTSFLWIQGPPGCGKTILSAAAVQNTLQYSGEFRKHGVAYFYFDIRDPQKSDVEPMIRSLVSQLLSQSIWPSDHLDELFRTCENGETQPSLASLLVVLRRMIEDFGQVHMIVDALDECRPRNRLFQVLSEMNTWNLKNLHIMLTSRAESDIQSFVKSIVDKENIVTVEGEAVDMEIRSYIRARLSDMGSDPKFKGSENQIVDTLVEKSDGIFLLAKSQLDLLAQRPNHKAVQQTLLQIPQTLDENYAHILSNISGEQSEAAVRILQWLTYGRRPLTVQEVAEAVAISFNQTLVSQQQFGSEDLLDLLGVLPSLITIRNADANLPRNSDGNSKSQERIVTLSHFSVKEFLTSESCRRGSAAKFYMQSEVCNSSIGNSCLDCLLQFNSFGTFTLERMKDSKLARYAAQHWIDHSRNGPKNEESSSSRIRQLFSPSNPAFYNWVRIYDHDKPQPEIDVTRVTDTILSPLYYASLLGLSEVVRSLVNSTDDISATKAGTFQTLLQAAAAGGHEQVVDTLLKNGANADEHGEYLQNALQVASAGGHEHIVNLLIDYGSNLNAQAGFYGNALQAASFMGHESMVRMLLRRGASVNAQGGEYCNALQAASIKGHEGIVKLLIDHGADVDAQGGSYFTSLRAATFGGHISTVELLLKYGADVNAQPHGGETAIELASIRGYTSIVQLLLLAGADIRKGSHKHGYPLSAAAFEGRFDIAELLIKAGASANYLGGEYGNALQAASYNDHKALLMLLLDFGANVNTKGGFFGSALYAASARGHLRIVDALLKAGAEINATFEDSGTAIYGASRAGHEQVVKQLLECRASVNVQGGQYGYALQAAAHGGHNSVVARLLDAAADVNALGGEYGTALEAACHGGYTKVANQLIEHGAEINAKAGFYGTPLQAAAFSGERDLVKLLIEGGALVNTSCGHYGHALEAASHQGHYEVVKILLAAGADVNLQGGEYDCALFAAFWESHDSVVDLLSEAGANANREGGSQEASITEGQMFTDLTQWVETVQKSGLVAPTMITLRFESEILKAMSLQDPFSDNEDRDQRFLNNVMMVRKHILDAEGEKITALEALTSHEYVTRQWGTLGELILKNLSTAFALETGAQMINSYFAIDGSEIEYSITFSDSYLLVHIEHATLDSNLTKFIDVIDTICRVIRIPQGPSAEGSTWLSSASYRGYKFNAKSSTSVGSKTAQSGVFLSSFLSKQPVDEFNGKCWQQLFESCYIIDETRPSKSQKAFGKGLEMSFDLMTVLANAEYFVPVQGGVVLVGYQTVLFPTELKTDYAQFHLEVDREKQINPFQRNYSQRVLVDDYTEFRGLRCFVGWCEIAHIKLGTKEMLRKVTYSTAEPKGKYLEFTGISLGAQAASAAPAQIGGNAVANYSVVSHRIAFAPSLNFSKMLRDTEKETVLIFDKVTRRSWLVPKLSLILHLAHIWLRDTVGTEDISTDPIPFAEPHEKASSLVTLLDKHGGIPVCGEGEDEYKLRTVMVGLNLNLYSTVKEIKPSKSGHLFGFEIMDIVTQPARGGEMKEVKVESGSTWLELANAADAVIICANLGEAMNPKLGQARQNERCNSLPSEKDFLAAHISCLIRIASRAGVSDIPQAGDTNGVDEPFKRKLLKDPGVSLHDHHFLNIIGHPFADCTHQANDSSSCWDDKTDMIQCLVHKSFSEHFHVKKQNRLPCPHALSENGAVVFGTQT